MASCRRVPLVAAFAWLAGIGPAPAHRWYPAWCCNDHDCRELEEDKGETVLESRTAGTSGTGASPPVAASDRLRTASTTSARRRRRRPSSASSRPQARPDSATGGIQFADKPFAGGKRNATVLRESNQEVDHGLVLIHQGRRKEALRIQRGQGSHRRGPEEGGRRARLRDQGHRHRRLGRQGQAFGQRQVAGGGGADPLSIGNTVGVAEVDTTGLVVAKAAPEATMYTVKKGDTLWAIAEHFYGKGKGQKYTDIVKANSPPE